MDRRAFLTPRRPDRAASPAPLAHAPAEAGLDPYTGPWTIREATHLVRRTHVGAARADAVAATTRGSASAAVDALLSAARARPLPDAPRWAGTLTPDDGANVGRLYEWQRAWYAEMAAGGLREKMTLFWHDHFATGHAVYRHAGFAVDYLTFLRAGALGRFRPLVQGIGTRPAMLRFLDNDTNRAGSLNENYGREVLELFTMGLVGPGGAPNYGQTDVREAARALTGWVVDEAAVRGTFQPARHDTGAKTIFGRTGAWGYDDVVALVFSERGPAVAHFLAGKLYAWFVHPVPDAGVVDALAARLAATDFDIAAAVRALLTSAHFYDSAVGGSRLKTPVELVLGIVRELGLPLTDAVQEATRVATASMGQEVLNPPSVEGWSGYDDALEYRGWLTTGTAPERRAIAENAVYGRGVFGAYDALPLVDQVSDRTDPYAIARDLAAHLLAPPLAAAATDALAEATLLDGVPDNYSRTRRLGYWGEIVLTAPAATRARLRNLLSALVNLPEYQLV